MYIERRPLSGLSVFGLMIVIALIFNSCSGRIREQPIAASTSALSTPQSNASPSPTATLKVTLTATAAPKVEPTTIPTRRMKPTVASMLTPTSKTNLEVFEIESGYTERQVVTAFWSDDGNSIYYAFVPAIGDKPLNWATYNVATHVKTNVSSPLKFDNQIWRRFNVPDPLANSSLYPELLGYLAPSSEHIIFTVNRGSRFAVPPDPNPVTEVWLADSTGQHKTKLVEFSQGMIGQAVWLENETKVIFDFGGDGGVRLYIADVSKGTVAPLSDVSDFKRGTEQLWAVSPDGSTLAIVDLQGTLWLVSLEDGKTTAIDKFTRNPTWSKDGKNVFYWWGETYNDTHILRAFETATGDVAVVLDQSSLASSYNGLRPSDFVVSSKGDKVVLWGGGLWLVELRK